MIPPGHFQGDLPVESPETVGFSFWVQNLTLLSRGSDDALIMQRLQLRSGFVRSFGGACEPSPQKV